MKKKKIYGTNKKPRISIFKSNKEIYVQIIDDINHHTILSYSSLKEEKKKMTKIQMSKIIGKKIAIKMLKNNIEIAFFDRKNYIYHGRIKCLIESIRKEGIKI
ncbi:MAG: 50S ribosomal protein L18 [Candidatus Shikimatogenerans bostrichidophilus]|nr:MAG: 50S ribosomal protein L18 [Candidatus Shikimatogenerans bostrichidophilus]